MKIRIAAIFIFIFLLGFSSVSYAKVQLSGTDISSLPEDWHINASASGNAGVDVDGGGIKLSFDTKDAAFQAKSELLTGYYNFSDGDFVMKLSTVLTDNDHVTKSLAVLDTKSYNIVEMLRFSEGKLYVFGGGAEVVFDGSALQNIVVTVDPVNGSGAVWLDDDLIFNGNIPNWKQGINFANLRFWMKNNANSEIAAESVWEISEFVCRNNTPFVFETSPQDQATVQIAGLDGISVSYGCEMAPLMYSKMPYTLKKDGRDIGFSISVSDSGIILIPDEGFEEFKTYELEISNVINLWGEQVSDSCGATFFTTAEGYELPQVCFSTEQSSVEITEGESCRLPIEVLQGNVEEVGIFINGMAADKLTKQPFVFLFSAAAGVYTLTPSATDSKGYTTYGPEIKITVTENDKPDITVEGIINGHTYDVSQCTAVTVKARDNNGIAQIELYDNGILAGNAGQDSAVFSLEGIGVGTHKIVFKATDVLGGYAEKEYIIEVTGALLNRLYENDFSSYSGNNALPSGMAGAVQRGYFSAEIIDPSRGKSLILGVEKNDSLPKGSPPYIGIPANITFGRVMIDFNMFISHKTEADGQYSISLKKDGGAEQIVAIFSSDKLNCYSKSGTIGKSLDYNTETWYHFNLIIDMTAKKYSLKIDDELVVDDGVLADAFDGLSYVRIYGANLYTVATFAAVDDVVVQSYLDIPYIMSVNGCATSDSTVAYNTGELEIELSSAIYEDSFNVKNITIEGADSGLEIEQAEADGNTVHITLVRPMESGTAYKVTLSGDTELEKGVPFGTPVSFIFHTSPAQFAVLNGSYRLTENGMYFVADVVNETGEEKKIYVISEIWKDDKYFMSARAEEVVVAAEERQQIMVKTTVRGAGECIKTYIWDCLDNPQSLANNVYVY